MAELFEEADVAEQAEGIGEAILEARSLRLTDLSVEMEGNNAAGYKRIQRYLQKANPRLALISRRCGICDWEPDRDRASTSLENGICGQAERWEDAGVLGLILATTYRGRAILCGMLTYSTRTIAQEAVSRNPHHYRAFASLKNLLGERPLAVDREFSYLELLLNLLEVQINSTPNTCVLAGSSW